MTTFVIGYGLRTNLGVDLNQTDRNLFFDKLTVLIDSVDGEVYFAGTGTGIYEGQTEPAGSITFAASDDDFTIDTLERGLAVLAVEFEQDSIALTRGATQFVAQDGTTSSAD
jgi:hypothetical protein